MAPTESPARNNVLLASYFLLFGLWATAYFVAIPVPVNLILTSTLIVYIGSHRSLNLVGNDVGEEGEQAGEDKREEIEMLSAKDAYMFPVFGSIALFSLYIAFKYFDKETVNLVLSLYFSLVGVFTISSSLSKFVAQFIVSTKQYGFKVTLPYLGLLDCMFTPVEYGCIVVGMIFSFIYFKTKNYMMNNIFGISFCLQSIERISVGSYKIGAILLIGLFFYDIFWVFGTDVMVTVAKSFDGPIKLLFPRVLPAAGVKGEFSLLGLGDIVIPGLFVALLLRLDAVRAKLNTKDLEYAQFFKPYFTANILAYAAGLGLTVGIMFFFQHAQPALLYLVPACLLASLAVGLARGELSVLFNYNEEELAAEQGKLAGGDDKKKSQ